MKIRVSIPVEFEVEGDDVRTQEDACRAANQAAYQCLAWHDGFETVTQEVDGVGKCSVRILN